MIRCRIDNFIHKHRLLSIDLGCLTHAIDSASGIPSHCQTPIQSSPLRFCQSFWTMRFDQAVHVGAPTTEFTKWSTTERTTKIICVHKFASLSTERCVGVDSPELRVLAISGV
jgi:hypothetical protein